MLANLSAQVVEPVMARKSAAQIDRVVRTVCSPNCLGTCGVNAHVSGDRIVRLEPASMPDPRFERICGRGIAMATQRQDHKDRITTPLMRVGPRGAGEWRSVSWDEAYERIIATLKKTADEHGWRSNAWLKGSGNYGYRTAMSLQRTANILGGTAFTYFGICGDFAAMIAYQSMLGEFARSNDISEVGGAKYFVAAGKNLADTAHSDMHFVFDAMEQGCKLVVVDPRFSRSAAKADEWVAPRPGTDAALALGMVHTVIAENLHREDYLLAHTNSAFLVRRDTRKLLRADDLRPGGGSSPLVWDDAVDAPATPAEARRPALRGARSLRGVDGRTIDCWTAFDASWEHWQQFTPESASRICDVPAGQIRHLAREYAKADPAWIWLGLGLQRYHHGHLPARAWLTLATLCGNIGKPHAGVGIYDAANLAMLLKQPKWYLEPDGRKAHSLPGTQLVDIVASGKPYPIKTLWMASYGFGTQTPLLDRFVKEALPQLDLFVITEQVMTSAAQWADIVLPCTTYYEEDWEIVGGGENWYVQLRRQVLPPRGEARSDHDIFKGLCERLGHGEYWQDEPRDLCRRILAEHPDARFRAVDWVTLEREGVAEVPVERPYTPFRDMKFTTPSGRIEVYQEQSVDLGEEIATHKEQFESTRSEKAKTYPLNLISYKHAHSTHGQHTMLSYIREQLPGPRLEISFTDAAARGIADGDWVRVHNDRGAFSVRAMVTPSLRPGAVAVPQGFWPRDYVEGHPSWLGHVPYNEAQARVYETNYPAWDILCEVQKVAAPAQLEPESATS